MLTWATPLQCLQDVLQWILEAGLKPVLEGVSSLSSSLAQGDKASSQETTLFLL